MNLLEETIEILNEYNKTETDILWCGNDKFYFSWGVFCEFADKEYNDGFGGQEVVKDLKVVGKDFWLERHEYDGSEWWEFKQLPTRPIKQSIPKGFFLGDWKNLEDD